MPESVETPAPLRMATRVMARAYGRDRPAAMTFPPAPHKVRPMAKVNVSLDAELVVEVMVLAGVGSPQDAVEAVDREQPARREVEADLLRRLPARGLPGTLAVTRLDGPAGQRPALPVVRLDEQDP